MTRFLKVILMMTLTLLLLACNVDEDVSPKNNEDKEEDEAEELEEELEEDESEELEEANSTVVEEVDQTSQDIEIFDTMEFVVDEEDEEIGTFEVKLDSPQDTYELSNGLIVEMIYYYPDYVLEDGEPASKSAWPRNPGFVFNIIKDDYHERMFFAIGKTVSEEDEPLFSIELNDFSMKEVQK